MALEWVRQNIAGFGGDPTRIVAFGQSAGSVSIDILSYAYPSDPIVSGVILESGTALSFGVQTQDTASSVWYEASSAVGCGNANTAPATVYECMSLKAAKTLTDIIPPNDKSSAGLPFGPVIDNKLIFADYDSQTSAPLPMLVGSNDNESALFDWMAKNPSRVPGGFWITVNNKAFTCSTASRVAISVTAGNPTWRYRWFGTFPNLLLDNSEGAYHGSEVRNSCR
jgi:cholinesterase